MNLPGRVVIVGAGQAGFQTAASLRSLKFHGEIVLINGEPDAPYQRPPLSKTHLVSDADDTSLTLRPDRFFERKQIEVINGRADHLDASRRIVRVHGREIGYDELVLATGARARTLHVDGESERVITLRTVADARLLRGRLATARDVVIVGGGVIGLEVAAAAAHQSVSAVIVERGDQVLNRFCSPPMAAVMRKAHLDHGNRIVTGAVVRAVREEPGRVVVELADGRSLTADVAVAGIGVEPDVDLALSAGLEVHDGIVVDTHLRTSVHQISAIGDCTSFPSHWHGARVRLESVQNAVDQARVVAARLTGSPAPYRAVPWFWTEQFGRKLQTAGPVGLATSWVATAADDHGGFSVYGLRDDQLCSVESLDRPADHIRARRLLAGEVDQDDPSLAHVLGREWTIVEPSNVPA